jgi:hypothetical protein
MLKAISNSGGSGGGGGIQSINGDTTAAQTIVGGTDITANTVGGTTTITYTGSSGGGGIVRSISNASSTTSAGSTAGTDYVYICTGTFTITLPTAVSNSNLYTIKNAGSGTITVATTSAQTIDGVSTASLYDQYQSYSIISNNSNWSIV